ncbi:hypothetical protein Tco_1011673 [Tanacetum coccineum]
MGSNIPMVFSWGSSIGPEGFLPSIMLLVVIIVVVMVILVVVVVEGSSIIKLSFVIIGSLHRISSDESFPEFFGGLAPWLVILTANSGIFYVMFRDHLLLHPSDLIGLFYSNRLGVRIPPGQGIISQGVLVGPVFLLGLLVLAIVAACAYRAAATLLATIDLTGDEDPTDEDGDIRMGDSIGVSVSLGGGISSLGKKSQESNIGGSDNTRDGGTTVGVE